LDIKLSDILSPHNPGCHSLTDIKRRIALNDAESPREAPGNALDKCKVALDRWLECVKTLVHLREVAGLEDDRIQ
jgi:hypothetical protein